jgi:hypothetical protein
MSLEDMFGSPGAADSEESQADPEMDLDIFTVASRRKLLQSRPQSCGLLAFHNGTEESLWLYVQRNATRGVPLSVLKAVDIFCYSRHW